MSNLSWVYVIKDFIKKVAFKEYSCFKVCIVHLIENRSLASKAEGVARAESREHRASRNCEPVGVSMSARSSVGI